MDQQQPATTGADRTPIAVVREIYEAFATKDIEAILALMHPDIVVEQDPALPWGGRHVGHEGLGTFMLALVGSIDSAVTIEGMFQAGDSVVQHGRTAGTVRATGVAFDIPECHVWRVVDGLAVEARYFIDSEAMLERLAAEA
ncbi:nuclear transport factor 2 family protein [Aquihabitans daechungensis]|uniref:nuclear transport factor 2 family protein n=1 Tax=Aquihabitans daechungensis TaxID=1052257 RepID=UPI003B9EC922